MTRSANNGDYLTFLPDLAQYLLVSPANQTNVVRLSFRARFGARSAACGS